MFDSDFEDFGLIDEVGLGFNYDFIKGLAKANKCRVNDLIALAPQNDPFYVGTESDRKNAEWFAALWGRFGYGSGVHLRRVHYQIISQDPSVSMPNGKPYENTEGCWDYLGTASKAARYLELVDPGAFVDRRNPEPAIFVAERGAPLDVEVESNLYTDSTQLPDFPSLPTYAVTGFAAEQPYHIEIWCEKSTMNDVLLPLCERYEANLVTGLGELSITAVLSVINRIKQSVKPARILYISDFDPAGACMPVSVARKIEFYIRQESPALDVRLFPLIMTAEQVRHYRLPRTPIKDTEKRRGAFEKRHGTGAVELDALQALHPGELDRLLRQAIEHYYDTEIETEVEAARARVQERLEATQQAITTRHESEINDLKAEHERIQEEFAERMASYEQGVHELWDTLYEEMVEEMPVVSAEHIPSAQEGSEIGEGMYDSGRDYMKQIAAYKSFQGKAA